MIKMLLTATMLAPPPGVIPDVTIYEGAQVWREEGGFEERDLIVSGGRILASVPEGASVTRTSLAGRYVVPPMANAHTHLTSLSQKQSWDYLKEGVYYAWNPNLIQVDGFHSFMARPDTYDVKTSWGGVTEPGGHPERLYTVQLREWVYKDRAEDSFLGDAFHYARTEAEATRALDLLSAQNADFVKMLLVVSEEYDKRRDDADFFGNKGLNPAMVPFLVREANRRGMPAYFHIETDHDAMVAASAGAQFLGHLPAYNGVRLETVESRRLKPATVAALKQAGTAVVPTYGLARYGYRSNEENGTLDVALRDANYALQGANIRALHEAGVPILTGTDSSFHVREEMAQWIDTGGMNLKDALVSAFTTARYLFPERRLQCFAAGCEADFLVLSKNPEEGIDALTAIELRVKAGKVLEAPAGA